MANADFDSRHLRSLVGDVGAALICPIDSGLLQQTVPRKHVIVEEPTTMTETSSSKLLERSNASLVTAASTDGDEWVENLEIEPESVSDLLSSPRILNGDMMQQLHDALSDSLKMHTWERCFCISRDGDSFITLLNRCQPYTYTLAVIQTTKGHVLGGFASERWQDNFGSRRRRQSYYGNGQSFLFASHPDTAVRYGDASKECSDGLSIFRWSGSNDYCQICDVENSKLAMGGVGDFGLIVQDNFWRGQTGNCRTYNNPPLVPGGAYAGFEVSAFEVYGLKPLLSTFSP